MANSLSIGRIGLALFAISLVLSPCARAKELVSNQYGFQLSIPPGFREHSSDVLNIIVEYIESDPAGGGYPITIDIRHTGTNYNAADKTAMYYLPRQKGWDSSLETRHWKDLDLQVIRQDIAISSSQVYLSYTIVFPLRDEGVIVVVQGQKNREKEVRKVFDDAVRQFVNLKPYIPVKPSAMAGEESHSFVQMLFNILLPVISGAIILFWITKVRKAKSKATQPVVSR
jgi:hypothetical protein